MTELKTGFANLTLKQIEDSHAIYLTEKTEDEIRTALTIFRTIFQEIQANTAGKALDFTTIPLPDKTPVYTKLIDLLISKEDKAYIAARDEAARTGTAFVAKKIPFEYGKQADADEFLLATFNFILDSDLDFLRIAKYLLFLETYESLDCQDKAKGVVESGNLLLYSLEFKVMIGQDMKTGAIQYIQSLQQGLDNLQKTEVLTAGNNELEACGTDGKKALVNTRTTILKPFSFTKYLLIKVARLDLGTLYNEPIEVNKVLIINGTSFIPRGVIVHTGGIRKSGETGGHYVYYHYEKGEPSILYDDSTITPLSGPAVQLAKDGIAKGSRVVLYERESPVDAASLPKLIPAEQEVLAANKAAFDAMLALPDTTAEEEKTKGDTRVKVTRTILRSLIDRLRKLDVVVGGGEILDLGDPIQTGTRKQRKHSKRFTRRDAAHRNHKK